MREILEIDKDFNLNSIKYSKKIKPNSTIKGKVNVSLYDKNNNLIRDIHTENLVMDWFKNETYERGFVDLIGKNTYKNSNFTVNPLGYLVLSDQNIEEDSKDPFVIKNTIGYAQRRTTYSGSDILKGTYNSLESSVYENEEGNLVCREVYDFPTHAGNGTINSLMWTPHYTGGATTLSITTSSEGGNYDFGATYDKENNIAYWFANNYSLYKLDYSNSTVSTMYTLWSSSTSLTTYSSFYPSIFIDPKEKIILGGIYNAASSSYRDIPSKTFLFAEWDLSTGKVKNSNFKHYTSSSLQTTINGELYIADNYGFYDGKEFIYYTIAKNSDKNYKGIVKAKFEDGSLVDTYTFENSCLSTDYSKIIIQNNDKFRFVCGDTDCLFDFSLNLLKTYKEGRPHNIFAGYENAYPHKNYRTNEIRLIDTPVTTYVKLPQAINKTNTNTMKVKYEFVIEQPKVLLNIMQEI